MVAIKHSRNTGASERCKAIRLNINKASVQIQIAASPRESRIEITRGQREYNLKNSNCIHEKLPRPQ